MNYPEHEKEGLEPHKVLDIFLIFSDQPDYTVDISSTIDKKIASLGAHESQISHLEDLAELIRERGRTAAEHVSFEYGETFRRVQLNR